MSQDNAGSDGPQVHAPTVAEFMTAVFKGVAPPAFIEVRVLSDVVKGVPPVARRWFSTVDELLSALPALNATAAANDAGVFYGVLPRRADGVGKNDDTVAGNVLWGDLDAKDYIGGIEDARDRVAKFALPPTALVLSGRGLHPYWILTDPVAPDVASRVVKLIAGVLGGDAVHDPARLLRIPGSVHRKDPAHPKPVSIEWFEPSRAYKFSDFDALLPSNAQTAREERRERGATERPAQIPDRISDRVLGLLERHPKLQRLFDGTGKPAMGEDGTPLDTTSSGYDFSVLLGLAAAGVKDELELAAVLWHRKDDAARTKGIDYILRTVRRALETAEKRGRRPGKDPWTPTIVFERVRIFLTDPATYEFTAHGTTFTVSAEELLKPQKFAVAFTNATQKVAMLPKAPEWAEYVTTLLETAERVTLPPEATRDGEVRTALERIIPGVGVGKAPEDLDRGKALVHNGVRIFKADAIYRLVVQDLGPIDKPLFYRVLHEVGYESDSFTIGSVSIRAWRPSPPPAASV